MSQKRPFLRQLIKVFNSKMKKATLEIYHEGSNFVVLKAPGRAYPGVLIQGDSLTGIVGDAREAIELFDSDREEALELLKGLYEQLNWRLEAYNQVCKENQIV
jgi:hypothetical protein